LYGNDTDESKGRRFPWMDLGEVRKAVRILLDEARFTVPWVHIVAGGHRVAEDEIRAALSTGAYELHEVVDGRYVATYSERGLPLAIVVIFELWEAEDREIRVLTAYTEPMRRRGPWRR